MATVGRYRIRRRLGIGGMAEVLEAEALGEAGFVRRVAIKRMLGAVKDDASFARMFLDEARIASRLHHANIVAVLDYGVVDGTPFQVLELVDGIDARTLMRRSDDGRVPEEVALHIVAQIGHALAAAHGAKDEAGRASGIVHRDVSPGNILLSWNGDVKLADFGIAFANDKTEKTETGVTKGTLVYMSPEQAFGRQVDGRSDVFSLGCVLHALVTGKSPLADGGAQRFFASRIIELSPSLPADLREIIESATRFDEDDRLASANAFTDAAGRALATRLQGEPRRRLMQYLEPLRAKSVEPRGRLDALLCVDIVADDGPTERHFHTATIEPAKTTSEPVGDAAGPTRILDAHTPRSRGLVGALIVGGALVAAAGWIWKTRAAPPPPLPSGPDAAVSSPHVALAASSPSAATDAGPIAVVAPPPSSVRVAPHAAPVPVAPRPSPACSGALFLSCPASPRATILIDGASSRYHHGDFATLSCGKHAIVFRAADGREDRHGATPTSANTETSPLEVRCRLE